MPATDKNTDDHDTIKLLCKKLETSIASDLSTEDLGEAKLALDTKDEDQKTILLEALCCSIYNEGIQTLGENTVLSKKQKACIRLITKEATGMYVNKLPKKLNHLVSVVMKLDSSDPENKDLISRIQVMLIRGMESSVTREAKRYGIFELLEECQQNYAMNVIENLPSYDPERAGLSTFLTYQVNNACLSTRSDKDGIKKGKEHDKITIARARRELEEMNITDPSPEALSDYLKLNGKRDLNPNTIRRSIENNKTKCSYEECGDVPSRIGNPEDICLNKISIEELYECILKLDRPSQLIIKIMLDAYDYQEELYANEVPLKDIIKQYRKYEPGATDEFIRRRKNQAFMEISRLVRAKAGSKRHPIGGGINIHELQDDKREAHRIVTQNINVIFR